jgi:hypothetical protein
LVDWTRDFSGIQVKDPESRSHEIQPGASKLIFDGVRTTTIDGTSAFSLSLLSGFSSLYRLAHTGGTTPGFRVGRNLTLNTCVATFTVLANNAVTLSVPALSPSDFTSVVVGDTIFIPGVATGDAAGVISPLNSGYWTVLAKASGLSITIVRAAGAVFEAVSETVTLTSNSQIRAFSSSGVQISDTVIISAGFVASTQGSYTITAVTDNFIEFVSTVSLAQESNITPGATGVLIYSESKNVLYIEADQNCIVRINGDTGDFQRLSPLELGNPSRPGVWMKTGATYSLTVVNKSNTNLNLLVISAT